MCSFPHRSGSKTLPSFQPLSKCSRLYCSSLGPRSQPQASVIPFSELPFVLLWTLGMLTAVCFVLFGHVTYLTSYSESWRILPEHLAQCLSVVAVSECIVMSKPGMGIITTWLRVDRRFLHWVFLAPLANIIWPHMHELFLGSQFFSTGPCICFMPVLHCFDHCKFVIKSEIRKKTKQEESMDALELEGQESSVIVLT